jgi:hypothetical protein
MNEFLHPTGSRDSAAELMAAAKPNRSVGPPEPRPKSQPMFVDVRRAVRLDQRLQRERFVRIEWSS